jgi:hypothetical protein
MSNSDSDEELEVEEDDENENDFFVNSEGEGYNENEKKPASKKLKTGHHELQVGSSKAAKHLGISNKGNSANGLKSQKLQQQQQHAWSSSTCSVSPLSSASFYGHQNSNSSQKNNITSNESKPSPKILTLKKKSSSLSSNGSHYSQSHNKDENGHIPKTRAAPTKAMKPLPDFLGGGRKIKNHQGQFVLVDMRIFGECPDDCGPVVWKGK